MTEPTQSGSAANFGRPLIQPSRIGADQRSDGRPLIQTSRIESAAPGHMALEITAALNCTADWPDPEEQIQARIQQRRRLPAQFRAPDETREVLAQLQGIRPWRSDSRADSDGTEVRYG